MLQLLEKHQPTHLACVFDMPGPTFRHEIYPEYKANRAEMPEDLRPQIPMIRQLVEALNIPIVELSGYEADDVMGTLARESAAHGLPAVIVSPDKDLLQLVDDDLKIQVLNTKDGEIWHRPRGCEDPHGRVARAGGGLPQPGGRRLRQCEGRARHRREGRGPAAGAARQPGRRHRRARPT